MFFHNQFFQCGSMHYSFIIKPIFTYFNMVCFIPCVVFSQELVSVDTEGRTGDLTVLGKVQHKMVCSPDFETLLHNNV